MQKNNKTNHKTKTRKVRKYWRLEELSVRKGENDIVGYPLKHIPLNVLDKLNWKILGKFGKIWKLCHSETVGTTDLNVCGCSVCIANWAVPSI